MRSCATHLSAHCNLTAKCQLDISIYCPVNLILPSSKTLCGKKESRRTADNVFFPRKMLLISPGTLVKYQVVKVSPGGSFAPFAPFAVDGHGRGHGHVHGWPWQRERREQGPVQG